MGGKACIRGMRVTVGMVVGQIGAQRRANPCRGRQPDVIGRQVIVALRQMASDLQDGALLTIEPGSTRLRVLPLQTKGLKTWAVLPGVSAPVTRWQTAAPSPRIALRCIQATFAVGAQLRCAVARQADLLQQSPAVATAPRMLAPLSRKRERGRGEGAAGGTNSLQCAASPPPARPRLRARSAVARNPRCSRAAPAAAHRQRIGITRRHQPLRMVAQNPRRAGGAARHHRPPAGHHLVQLDRVRVVAERARRVHHRHHVQRLIQRRHVSDG